MGFKSKGIEEFDIDALLREHEEKKKVEEQQQKVEEQQIVVNEQTDTTTEDLNSKEVEDSEVVEISEDMLEDDHDDTEENVVNAEKIGSKDLEFNNEEITVGDMLGDNENDDTISVDDKSLEDASVEELNNDENKGNLEAAFDISDIIEKYTTKPSGSFESSVDFSTPDSYEEELDKKGFNSSDDDFDIDSLEALEALEAKERREALEKEKNKKKSSGRKKRKPSSRRTRDNKGRAGYSNSLHNKADKEDEDDELGIIKKIIPVVVITVAAIALAVGVSFALTNGKQKDKKVEETTSYNQDDNPLQESAYEDISDVVRLYYEAKVAGDVTALAQYVDNMDNITEESLASESTFIDEYTDITCYTKTGLYPNTYVVFVSYELSLKNITTSAPGISILYVIRDEETGNIYIHNGVTEDKVLDYISMVSKDDDVVSLYGEVNTALNDALASDANLKAFYDGLSANSKEETQAASK